MANFVNNSAAVGFQNAIQGITPPPIISLRAPTVDDRANYGQVWIWRQPAPINVNTGYVYIGSIQGNGQWSQLAYAPGDLFPTLTVNPGPFSVIGATNLTGPTNINTAGAANTLINTGAGTGNVTIGSVGNTPAVNVNANGNITLTSNSVAGGAIALDAPNGGISINGSAADPVDINSANSIGLVAPNVTIVGIANINDGVNNNTNINTGTSNGTVFIGNDTNGGVINIASAAAGQNAINIASTAVTGGIQFISDSNSATTGVSISNTVVAASIYVGAGAPGFVAPQSSLYINTTGGANTHLYINVAGANVWTPVASAA